ncbi:MAG: hypothetical protein IGS54_28265 [Elainella sp. C42_A2020_010]|nr:hypothetical protein [Elainella sp. C42_A2020_010]
MKNGVQGQCPYVAASPPIPHMSEKRCKLINLINLKIRSASVSLARARSPRYIPFDLVDLLKPEPMGRGIACGCHLIDRPPISRIQNRIPLLSPASGNKAGK